jgi:large subunit ribosomal protein L10
MVAQEKLQEVQELKQLLRKHPVIAVSSLHGLPADQYNQMRKKLRGKAEVRVTKMTLLNRAIAELNDKKLGELEAVMEGPTALVFSDMNAFKLFNFLKKNKGRAPAKAGQVAPFDIVVPAGDTGLPPGPALGELKKVGINAKIEGPTIKVVSDSVVCKKGQTVSQDAAAALNKLNIRPMEIGMSLVVALEEGLIYKSDVLNIDEEKVLADFVSAHRNAVNLSVNSAYPTKATISVIIQKAFSEARNLGVNAEILDRKIIDLLMAKAAAQAGALKSLVK